MSRHAIGVVAGAVRRRLWLARAALLWERLWPAIWPASFVAGVFVATALFGVWSLVPGWLHAAALAIASAAFAVALVRGVRGVRLPSETDAIRRLERASGLEHRPLAALRDRPAAAPGDRTVLGLWQAHLERMALATRRLRVGLASPRLARHDTLGLRAALLLTLVIAIAAAGENGPSRLAHGFQPDLSGLGAHAPAGLTLWITPPPYTGAAPVFLAAGRAAELAMPRSEVTVPDGSTVLARVYGGRGVPRLDIDNESLPFVTIDSANYELRATLVKGRRLAVVQDRDELAAWALSIISDQPPVIEFTKPPGRSFRSALRLDHLAEDDYGVVAVHATIRRADDPEQSFVVDLPLTRAGAKVAEETSFHDLTPHPWAGIAVTITLGAVDAIGQTGTSEAVPTVLPERIFNHPVARALIEQRKALTLNPSKRAEVSRALDEISRKPKHFFEDLTVYLALRTARWRLLYDRSDKVVGAIQDLLWDLALTIEEGPLALAEEELRQAQQALLDALSRDAADEEIEKLIDELRAALDKFLDAFIEQAMKQGDMLSSLEDQMLQAVPRDQLIDLVERVRELYRTGARDAARQLLSQLQQVLENLRAGRFAGIDRQGMGQGEAALRGLEQMIERQQGLLDETFRRSQGSGGAEEDGQSAFARQERLRRELRELMLQWGETGASIPRALGRADRSMREAGRALQENLPGQAVGPQTEAIDQMQQGAQAMLDALLQQLAQGALRPGGNSGLFGGQRDPLGRGLLGRGYQDDGRTRVPDEAELQRSRAILEELHRRVNDFKRPAVERDYLQRLLRRF